MEALFAAAAEVLKSLGVTGVLIGGLGFLCYYFLTQWQASQDARIVEGKEAVKAIAGMQESLARLVELLKVSKN